MNKSFLFGLCLWLTATSITADTFPDPFGLSWSMSTNDLTDIGFYFNGKTGPDDQFDEYFSESVPKPWVKGKRYRAMIFHDKILRLEVQSTMIKGDPFGATGKRLYDGMVSLMTKKYGEPSYIQEGRLFGESGPYDGIDEFYQCIHNSVCMYMTTFSVSDGSIVVWLQATEQGSGFLTITYESPDMRAAQTEAAIPDAVDFYASEDEVF